MTATNWTDYNVPQLAGILDQDLADGWNHVWAWVVAADMLDAARDQLEAARTALANVWTAEKSPAAQEFFSFVDQVSASMAQTSAAATANRSAMQQVLDSQAATQSAVNDLHGSWEAWTHDVHMPVDVSQQADTASVLNDLNARARQHMVTADQVIDDAVKALVVPSVLETNVLWDPLTPIPGTDGTSLEGGEGVRHVAGSGPGPGIPVLSGGATSVGSGGADSGGLPEPRGSVTIPVPGGSDSSGIPSGSPWPPPGTTSGDMNGGGSAPPGRSVGAVGSSGSGANAGNSAGLHQPIPEDSGNPPGAYPGTGVIGGVVPGGSRSNSRYHGSSVAGALADDPWQPPLGSAGTMQPGPAGEIGYVDGSPVVHPAMPAGTGSMVATTAGAPSSDGFLPPMLGAGGWRSAEHRRRSTSMVPWDLPTGVPAVLVPAVESDVHDPGPGVIGIDR